MEDNEICAICLENISSDDEYPNCFNCQHKFHSNCVNQWINTKLEEDTIPVCPTCKNECDLSYLINRIIQERINQTEDSNIKFPIVVIKPSINININQNTLSISKVFKICCIFYTLNYFLKGLLGF